jgi:hypothetical protein
MNGASLESIKSYHLPKHQLVQCLVAEPIDIRDELLPLDRAHIYCDNN